MTVRTPTFALQAGSHPAEHDRLMLEALLGGVGVAGGIVGATALAVSQHAGTPGMSVDVARGHAFVPGSEGTHQGKYHFYNDAAVQLTIAAADGTNPRKDIVVAKIRDGAYSGASNDMSLAVVTGTPTVGLTQGNATGRPAAPANSIVLAEVFVTAGVTSILDAKLTDLRALATGLPTTSFIPVRLGYAQSTTPQTSIGTGYTDITGAAVTVTVVAGRKILVQMCANANAGTAAAQVSGVIREGSTVLQVHGFNAVANGAVGAAPWVILTPSAGSHTYKCSWYFSANANNVIACDATYPAIISVIDLGP